MRFWDSSGLVPLVFEESSTRAMRHLLEADPEIAIWWGTPVECASAVARRARLEATPAKTTEAYRQLDDLFGECVEAPASERLRNLAARLVRVHDLRAAHAFQLAAATIASEDRPETLELVTLDERLALAATREGFRILPG